MFHDLLKAFLCIQKMDFWNQKINLEIFDPLKDDENSSA
jgi:hypothetical protein